MLGYLDHIAGELATRNPRKQLGYPVSQPPVY